MFKCESQFIQCGENVEYSHKNVFKNIKKKDGKKSLYNKI
jgi:hypothetical protein